MKKTLIFSDIHLKAIESDRARRAEFAAFLRSFSFDELDRVICLGDLFDFWFEYQTVIFSDFFEVLCCFSEMRRANVELHLVCGNHDFWAGRFLGKELGFNVHQDRVRLPFGERTALLVHGDGINVHDRAYRVYKRFARNPWVIRAFRLLHPDWAMAIARGVSHGSRSVQRVDEPGKGAEARALRAFAQETLARGEADIVMCGHAHAPVIETHPAASGEGLYINPGDWLHHRSHVIWDGRDFHLHGVRPPA